MFSKSVLAVALVATAVPALSAPAGRAPAAAPARAPAPAASTPPSHRFDENGARNTSAPADTESGPDNLVPISTSRGTNAASFFDKTPSETSETNVGARPVSDCSLTRKRTVSARPLFRVGVLATEAVGATNNTRQRRPKTKNSRLLSGLCRRKKS